MKARIGGARAGTSWSRLAWCCALLVLCAPLALQAQQAAPERRAAPGAGASAPAQQADPTAETQHENPDPYADLPAPTGKPAPRPDEEHKTEDVQLKGVEVQGKRDVLHDADKRLKALQDSLPCSGCDVPPRKKKLVRRIVDKAINEVTPQPPPERSHEVNDKAQEYSQDGQCIGVTDARRCSPENTRP